MANSYTQWSIAIKNLTPEMMQWLTERLKLTSDYSACPLSELPSADAAKFHKYVKEGWLGLDDYVWDVSGHRADADSLYIYNDGVSGSLEVLATLLLVFTRVFKRQDIPIVCPYAMFCDKPRVGEFGGGYFIVYKNRVSWQNTYRMIAKFEKRTGKQVVGI